MSVEYKETTITNVEKAPDNSFIFTLEPSEKMEFKAGQFCMIKNLAYSQEPRAFSIASSPSNEHLEFGVKSYGPWTQNLSKLKTGSTVMVSGPYGVFTLDEKLDNIIFLIGGIGITPIMSMLRYAAEKKLKNNFILLYGNRTPATVIYKSELDKLGEQLNLKIVDIYSDLEESDPWKGYRGFITPEIIHNECDLDKKPIFYIVGPPIFVSKMRDALGQLNVEVSRIRQENF